MTFDTCHALKLELYQEMVFPRGSRLLPTYMVATPLGHNLRSPVTDSSLVRLLPTYHSCSAFKLK